MNTNSDSSNGDKTPLHSDLLDLVEQFNELEKLFKSTQQCLAEFSKKVLNEYRYFSRALVELQTANLSEPTQEDYHALAKCRLAVATAFHDLIDHLVIKIKQTRQQIRADHPMLHENVIAEIEADHCDLNTLEKALMNADTMIANSRFDRSKRIEMYLAFRDTDYFGLLILFSQRLGAIRATAAIRQAAHSTNSLHLDELLADIGPENASYIKSIVQSERYGYPISRTLVNLCNALHPEGIEDPESSFEVFYQPKFECTDTSENPTFQVIGYEALGRFWMNVPSKEGNKKQFLSPAQFLPLLAMIDRKADFDLLMASKVAHDIKKNLTIFQQANCEFRISANVYPETITAHDYCEKLQNLFTDEAAKFLSLEILEKFMHEDSIESALYGALRQLPENVTIEIDDFGQGQTQLYYLATIPQICSIKLDKAYSDWLRTSNAGTLIKLIEGIAKLNTSLDHKVLAEGVENKDQVIRFIEAGITRFQGWVFGKATPLAHTIKDFPPGKAVTL